MKVNRIVKSGFRILNRNKLRTFFMTLGIIVGTVALFISMSFGEGSQKSMMDSVEYMFSKSSIFLTKGGGGAMSGEQSTRDTKLTMATAEALLENVSSLIMYDPLEGLGNVEATYQGNTLPITVYGGTENYSMVWNRELTKGEPFQSHEVNSSARVAYLGYKTAQNLFGSEDPIGKQIRLNNTPYEVKGILEAAGLDTVHGIDRDDEIVVPITTLNSRLRNVDNIGSFKFIIERNADPEQTASQMTDFLRSYHEIQEDELNDFTIITPVAVQEMVGTMNQTFTLLLPLIALISMAVGGLVIAVLMLMNVKERSMEIGLRKAVGARNSDVFTQFLIEIGAIAFVGAVIGLAISFFTLQIFTMHGKAMVASPTTIAMAFMAPIVIGILAGILPANKAAKLDPIVTLQA